MDWCLAPAAGLIEPDLGLFLDYDVVNQLKVRRPDLNAREVGETEEFQARVVSAYAEMMRGKTNWAKIDGNQSEREVARDVVQVCRERFGV